MSTGPHPHEAYPHGRAVLACGMPLSGLSAWVFAATSACIAGVRRVGLPYAEAATMARGRWDSAHGQKAAVAAAMLGGGRGGGCGDGAALLLLHTAARRRVGPVSTETETAAPVVFSGLTLELP